jgi:hypothetical protein
VRLEGHRGELWVDPKEGDREGELGRLEAIVTGFRLRDSLKTDAGRQLSDHCSHDLKVRVSARRPFSQHLHGYRQIFSQDCI